MRPLAPLDPDEDPGLGIGNLQTGLHNGYYSGIIAEARISSDSLAPADFLPAPETSFKTTHWQHDPATPGDWSIAGNWDNGKPGPGDTAHLTNGGEAQIAGETAQSMYLHVGYGGGESGTVSQTGGMNQTQILNLGYEAEASGAYSLSNGELSVSLGEYIGRSGTGNFVQTGGTHHARKLHLGHEAGANGAYSMSDGRLDVTLAERIGVSGKGSFVQTGGVHHARELSLGHEVGASGEYSLSNGELIVSGTEYVGRSGTGSFTQSGGSHMVERDLYLGEQSGANGTYRLDGGELTTGKESGYYGWPYYGYVHVEYHGQGTFIQTGGTHTIRKTLVLGNRLGSRGTYLLAGGELTIVGARDPDGFSWQREESIGPQGQGTFVQTGGTHNVGRLIFGAVSGGSGAYLLSGGELIATEYVSIRRGGFMQTGGTHIARFLNVGSYGVTDAAGTYTMSGGSLVVNSLVIHGTGGATFSISGGSLNAGSLHLGRGTLDISGIPNVTISGEFHVLADGHVLAVPGSAIRVVEGTFENSSADPAALSGLSNLAMTFDGGNSRFEVAGQDMGAIPAGFENNFGLHSLALEGGVRLRLVDFSDNQPEWEGTEALYLDDLVVSPGSWFFLNGINAYVNGVLVSFGDGAIYGGGAILGHYPDMDGDGHLNSNDINPFVLALTDPGAYAIEYGQDPNVVGDIDGDGFLTGEDIQPFVDLLLSASSAPIPRTGSRGRRAIPEPATLMLLAFGTLALIRRKRK